MHFLVDSAPVGARIDRCTDLTLSFKASRVSLVSGPSFGNIMSSSNPNVASEAADATRSKKQCQSTQDGYISKLRIITCFVYYAGLLLGRPTETEEYRRHLDVNDEKFELSSAVPKTFEAALSTVFTSRRTKQTDGSFIYARLHLPLPLNL